MYFVYKYYCDDELIYVGKAKDWKQRHKSHRKSIWYTDCNRYEVASVDSNATACMYEIFYITTLNPKHNVQYNDNIPSNVIELTPLVFDVKDTSMSISINTSPDTITSTGFVELYKPVDNVYNRYAEDIRIYTEMYSIIHEYLSTGRIVSVVRNDEIYYVDMQDISSVEYKNISKVLNRFNLVLCKTHKNDHMFIMLNLSSISRNTPGSEAEAIYMNICTMLNTISNNSYDILQFVMDYMQKSTSCSFREMIAPESAKQTLIGAVKMANNAIRSMQLMTNDGQNIDIISDNPYSRFW